MMKLSGFLKPLVVTSFMILLIELIQIQTKLNYYHSNIDFFDALRITGLVLVVACVFSIVLAAVLALVSSVVKKFFRRGEGYILSSLELLCAFAVFLTWAPAFAVVVTRDFPGTMRFFWLWGYGLLPLAVILFIIGLRVFAGKKFLRVLYNIVNPLYKPTLALALCAFFWLVAGLAVEPGVGGSKAQAEPSSRPNIILITFDTLSSRDMSLYGYHLKTTPFWEELSRQSFVFENMRTNFTKTTPSIVSMLTGKYPWTHGVLSGEGSLDKNKRGENLPEELSGYYRSAVVSYNLIVPTFLGLGDSFEHSQWDRKETNRALVFLNTFVDRIIGENRETLVIPLARHLVYLDSEHTDFLDLYGETFFRAIREIERNERRPFFLWVHIWPPHAPYLPPEPYTGYFLSTDERVLTEVPPGFYKADKQRIVDKIRLRYDENIRYSDSALRWFVDRLREKGLFDSSLTIITGDHGEIFRDGWFTHSSPFLAEGEIAVPLLIHMPGQREGRRIAGNVEMIDLAPTILDVAGRAVPSWMEGESLRPYMEEEGKRPTGTKFSMISDWFAAPDNKKNKIVLIAAYRGDHKLVYDLRTEGAWLYDLKRDPDEKRDIKELYPKLAAEMIDEVVREIEGSILDE